MIEPTGIATWGVLQEFGFTADPSVWSDYPPGLSYDFGNMKLSASDVLSPKSFVSVILFTGLVSSHRRVTEVQFEMPRCVESREQCAAWIVWHLDRCAHPGLFQPERVVSWLKEGRDYVNLLPWEVERDRMARVQEAFRARPHCTVQREWLKLALKELRELLSTVEDGELVNVEFDGEVLSFRLAENVVVVGAKGARWTSRFALPAGNMRNLPKRLMTASVDVSVWVSWLNIDKWRYEGNVEAVSNSKKEETS